jgi:peptidoglycan-N-acetylglucosamine deacetylase
MLSRALDLCFQHVKRRTNLVKTENPVASLTFDDGPDPVYTPKVLDILKKYDARATFFMVGEAAYRYRDIVKCVAMDGHAIGNHSWNHHAFPLLSFRDRWEQINRCQRALEPYGQRLFRPPYGMSNKSCNLEIFLHGYRVIGWSLSSDDWCECNPGKIVNNVVNNIKAGSVVLLHDRLYDEGKPEKGPSNGQESVIDRESMLIALRELLDRLKDKYKFVTIPELLQCGRAER